MELTILVEGDDGILTKHTPRNANNKKWLHKINSYPRTIWFGRLKSPFDFFIYSLVEEAYSAEWGRPIMIPLSSSKWPSSSACSVSVHAQNHWANLCGFKWKASYVMDKPKRTWKIVHAGDSKSSAMNLNKLGQLAMEKAKNGLKKIQRGVCLWGKY